MLQGSQHLDKTELPGGKQKGYSLLQGAVKGFAMCPLSGFYLLLYVGDLHTNFTLHYSGCTHCLFKQQGLRCSWKEHWSCWRKSNGHTGRATTWPYEDHTLPGAPKTVSHAHCRNNGSHCKYPYSKAHGFPIAPPADGFINSQCSQAELPSGALRQLSTIPFLPGSLALPCGLNREHHVSFPIKSVSISEPPSLVFRTVILQISRAVTVTIQRHP